MFHYCIDENYYRVIDRLMGIITETFIHLLFSDILLYRKFNFVTDHINKTPLLEMLSIKYVCLLIN